MAAEILRGTKPADIPVESPMPFFLAIKVKTAKTPGLAGAALHLMEAYEVIE
jgi:putative ABC transport system substrate-binding protein